MEIHGWYANHPCLYHLVPKYTWYYMMIHLESSQLFQCQYGSRICRKDLHILFVRKGLPRNDHWLSLMFCWLCKLLVLNCWLNTILSIHIQLLLILRVDINVHIHVVHQWFVHFWLYIYQESIIKIIKYWWLLMKYTGLYTNIYQLFAPKSPVSACMAYSSPCPAPLHSSPQDRHCTRRRPGQASRCPRDMACRHPSLQGYMAWSVSTG